MHEEQESTMRDTSGNDPAPVVDFAPLDPAPEEVTPRLEPETPEKPVEVVSVDELLDRLTDTEGTTGEAEETTEAGTELEENTETGEIPGEPVVVEEVSGPSNSDMALELLETIQKDVSPHPFLTTDFADYTVTEGLLLLALLLSVISLCIKMLKEGFSWL